MLTADLAMSWQRGDRVKPRHINPEDAEHLREAEDLIGLFAAHEGAARAALDQSLAEYVGTDTSYRVTRGMIKLLTDRCTFETETGVDPSEIRRQVFTAARARHPVTNEGARAEVLGEVAAGLLRPPEEVLEALYADLPANQKLVTFEPLSARELLDLYNLAQAQALLYRCVEMRLWVEPQTAEGYRELFGAIKAYRLIHTVRGSAARGYEIRLDGPVSMFQRSQKYGVQMAVFLPALLLCGGWRMRAEISSKPGGVAFFELTSAQTGLRSHYLSTPAYENPAVEKLASSWARRGGEWSLSPSSEVVDLGESVFVPDYVIRRPTGERFYLEVLGFWTPQHLRARLKEFEHGGVNNFLLAAWDDLRGSREPLTSVPPHVIVFKKNLDPAVVELTVEKLLGGEEWAGEVINHAADASE